MGERGGGGADRGIAYTLEPGIAQREGGHIYEGVNGTLRVNAGDNQMAVAYSFDSLASNSMKSSNPHSGCRQTQVAKTLDCFDPNPAKNQGGIAIVESVAFVQNQRDEVRDLGDVAGSLSAERGTHQQTFVAEKLILDDQGGQQINVRTDGNNTPFVVEGTPVVFDGSAVTSPINASNPQPGDPCHTLSTDSRNYVVEPVYCLQGNGIDRADTAGCNGKGVKEDVCYTLNTIDRPAVAFQTYQKVTGPLMANSHPGSYTGQDAFSDMLVAGKEETPVVLDRAFFNQGQNAKYDPQFYTDGTVPTLVARGPSAVQVRYIVRRLTPTECARLQGFPDKWGHPDEKLEFTDEEYQFWLNVRNTHAAINGKATKNYTKEQILKWYNNLHTDSSEYKMWGNGIALPNALYVMQGIADVLNQ